MKYFYIFYDISDMYSKEDTFSLDNVGEDEAEDEYGNYIVIKDCL